MIKAYELNPANMPDQKNLIINTTTPTSYDDVESLFTLKADSLYVMDSLSLLNCKIKENPSDTPLPLFNGQVLDFGEVKEELLVKASRLLYNSDGNDAVTINAVSPYRYLTFFDVNAGRASGAVSGNGKFSVMLETSRKTGDKYAVFFAFRNNRKNIIKISHRFWTANVPAGVVPIYEVWRVNADYPATYTLGDILHNSNPVLVDKESQGITVTDVFDGSIQFGVALSVAGTWSGAGLYALVPANFRCYHYFEIEYLNL